MCDNAHRQGLFCAIAHILFEPQKSAILKAKKSD